MADELTDSELEAIEARAAAALPGPWRAFIEGRNHDSGSDFIQTGGVDDSAPDIYVTLSYHGSEPEDVPQPADWDFIAHAREDVPRLVAEVRRLRQTIEGTDSE